VLPAEVKKGIFDKEATYPATTANEKELRSSELISPDLSAVAPGLRNTNRVLFFLTSNKRRALMAGPLHKLLRQGIKSQRRSFSLSNAKSDCVELAKWGKVHAVCHY